MFSPPYNLPARLSQCSLLETLKAAALGRVILLQHFLSFYERREHEITHWLPTIYSFRQVSCYYYSKLYMKNWVLKLINFPIHFVNKISWSFMVEAVTNNTVISKHNSVETLMFKLSSQSFYVLINKYKNHSFLTWLKAIFPWC